MRTFHEKGINKNASIRISYHGKSHYNSVTYNNFYKKLYKKFED